MRFAASVFKNLGLGIIDKRASPPYSQVEHHETQDQLRIFKATFGVSWMVCEAVWNLLDDHGLYRDTRQPMHLMWCLVFLKVYANEHVNANMVGTTAKTFRKWVWRVMEEIASLKPMVVRS